MTEADLEFNRKVALLRQQREESLREVGMKFDEQLAEIHVARSKACREIYLDYEKARRQLLEKLA